MQSAGVYLSIPFCRQKCTYCNFASEAHAPALLPGYLRALEREIAERARFWAAAGIPASEDMPVDSIYLGGGTPGMLRPEELASLLGTVRACFSVPGDAEITLEASPENATRENAAAWAYCGVNRVSMGVQSMVTQELRAVGRRHSAETVADAFAALRYAGIANISVDLIAGLPHQTTESWQSSLEALLRLAPPHFSVYMLEVDEDSRLGREILSGGSRYTREAVPSDEQVADQFSRASERLRAAGYVHYEISNFARPGRHSRHNEKYWTGAPYFGFGVEAHSYDGRRRWANTDSLTDYMAALEKGVAPLAQHKTLSVQEKLEERLFLGLRRLEGLRLSDLEAEFRASVRQKYAEQIGEFCRTGWMETDGDHLCLTERGLLFSNEIFASFLA